MTFPTLWRPYIAVQRSTFRQVWEEGGGARALLMVERLWVLKRESRVRPLVLADFWVLPGPSTSQSVRTGDNLATGGVRGQGSWVLEHEPLRGMF